MKSESRYLVVLLALATIFPLFSSKLYIPEFNRSGHLHFTALNGILQSASMLESNQDYLCFLCMRVQRFLKKQPEPIIRVAVNTNNAKLLSPDSYKKGLLKSIQRVEDTYLLGILLEDETQTIFVNPFESTVLINITHILPCLNFDQVEAFNWYFQNELGLPNQFEQVV